MRVALPLALGMAMAANGSLDQLPYSRPEKRKSGVITRNDRIPGTQLRGKALLGQARCDAKLRTYVRTYDGELVGDLELLRVPVMRLDRQGNVTGEFAIRDADPNLVVGDFFVTSVGEVVQVAFDASSRAVYLALFAEDGSLQKKIRLHGQFIPYQLVVFRNGNVLVSGLRYPDGFGKRTHEPYTALFDLSGELLKEVYFPEDAALAVEAEKGNADFVSPNSRDQGNLAVEFGDAAMLSNGNMYLMRRTSTALIYEIDPGGDVVRTIRITHEDGWMPVTLKSARNAAALLFTKEGTGKAIVKVIDARGRAIRTQPLHQSFGQALSCYAPPNFFFVGSAAGVIRLDRATPQ